jgi:hypothetical protein
MNGALPPSALKSPTLVIGAEDGVGAADAVPKMRRLRSGRVAPGSPGSGAPPSALRASAGEGAPAPPYSIALAISETTMPPEPKAGGEAPASARRVRASASKHRATLAHAPHAPPPHGSSHPQQHHHHVATIEEKLIEHPVAEVLFLAKEGIKLAVRGTIDAVVGLLIVTRVSKKAAATFSPLVRRLGLQMVIALICIISLQGLSAGLNSADIRASAGTAAAIDAAAQRRERAATIAFQAREMIVGPDIIGT